MIAKVVAHVAPIVAASTLPLSGLTPRKGRLDPDEILSGLALVRSCGTSHVDLTDSWLPIASLTERDIATVRDALSRTGLAPVGVSVVRHSILDPTYARENLEHNRSAIALAAVLGAPVVSIGFHEGLPPRASTVLFWAFETPLSPRRDPVVPVRDLADEAAAKGIALALELYEGGPLGSGRQAFDLVERINRPNVGINLDVGNLYRSPLSLDESWSDCVATCLPVTNYWHVKNYRRIYQHPTGRMVGSIASMLPDGDIDYRRCLAAARLFGYQGPFIVEQYSGDGIAAQRAGVAYLKDLLEEWTS
jgi:sugar phosphate isomerase/epimerase